MRGQSSFTARTVSTDFLPFDLPPSRPSAPVTARLAALVLLDGTDLEFHYAIPEELEAAVAQGSRVRVPLRDKSATGTVLRVEPVESAQGRRLRLLLALLDPKPVLTDSLLRLGRWISEYYCSRMESVMRAMLPESVRSNVNKPREVKFVRLLREPTQEEAALLQRKAVRQWEVVVRLQQAGSPVPLASLAAGAVKGLLARCATPALAEKPASKAWPPLIAVAEDYVERDPTRGEEFIPTSPLPLNDEQAAALSQILLAVANPADHKPLLLYGVTGSGKTEVYLQAAQRVLDLGKTVLALVPEISLTPQTVDRFKSRFAHLQRQVAVLHSQLSAGERFDEWHKIARGTCRIVIGARSAVFAPLENLGLILVDEEHENSYKQDSPPRYHGRDVAVVRATMEKCAIVLGSATPSLESWHNVQRGKYRVVQMMRRADHCRLPLVRVIDMKLESKKGKRTGQIAILSERLRMAVDQRLQRGEQTILFLNRRGYARSIVCQSCGHAVRCGHCSVNLRLHQEEAVLICHICGYRQKAPRKCPACSDPAIFLAGFGTERVEETLRKMLPQARIARVDADSMQQKHALRDTLQQFKARKLDILVGTQMIAKGLHFPNVTLVGILNADLTLHLPDFRSGERTFQLLTQVAGRAGRGEVAGEVIVQTFTPHSPSVQFARHHDFDGYAAQELAMRREFGHPPYSHAVMLTLRSKNRDLAEFCITTLAGKFAENLPPEILMGDPCPSPLEKAHDQYRFQIFFRSRSAPAITRHIIPILEKERRQKDIITTVDVDPVDLM